MYVVKMKKIFASIAISLILIAGCSNLVITVSARSSEYDLKSNHFFVDVLKNRINSRFKSSDDDHRFFPVDMDFKDGAFCEISHRRHVQWWYFDAVFDNGYSVHVGFLALSKGHQGVFFPGLNIYKDGEMKFHKRIAIPFSEFSDSKDEPFWASEEIPWVKSFGDQMFKAHIDENGTWIYNVSLEIEGQRADLQFTGIMKGWKSDIPKARPGQYYSSWCVPQPKARVNGTITLDGETINVNGTGYHEHAWKLYSLPQGWYWAKVAGDSINIIFSMIWHSRFNGEIIGVLNHGASDYVNIDPEKTEFKVTKYKYNNRMMVPTEIVFKTNDEENDVCINITMETVEMSALHILSLRYHRQHMKITGTITFGS